MVSNYEGRTGDEGRAADGGRTADEGRTIDVSQPESSGVGSTRGEVSVEIGPPSDHPDHAEFTVRRGESGVICSIDVTAGDHGTGHADVSLTGSEARALRDTLDELVG